MKIGHTVKTLLPKVAHLIFSIAHSLGCFEVKINRINTVKYSIVQYIIRDFYHFYRVRGRWGPYWVV